MTNEKKAILITLIVVAITVLFFAIKAIVSLIKNPSAAKPKQETKPIVTVGDQAIGKIAYANSDNVIVLNSDFTIYKIAKKDEWVGTVYGVGEQNYQTSGNRYVLKGDVYLK